MPRNRLPRVMKRYSPTGRRNDGRILKRLLDTWERNGSTSGPTPWQRMMMMIKSLVLWPYVLRPQTQRLYNECKSTYPICWFTFVIKSVVLWPYILRPKNQRFYNECKSTDPILVGWRSAVYEPPEDGFKGDRNM
jgi:hypothetical protein